MKYSIYVKRPNEKYQLYSEITEKQFQHFCSRKGKLSTIDGHLVSVKNFDTENVYVEYAGVHSSKY